MYDKTAEVIYKYTSNRLKIRKKFLKLTNDLISTKKIYVHYEEYIDYPGGGKDNLPERYIAMNNPEKVRFDSTLISRIINNNRKAPANRNSPNPYLIPPVYEKLLQNKFQFCSKRELFWGDDENEKYYINNFYFTLFSEILENNSTEVGKYLELLLYEYVPFSENITYYRFIKTICIEELVNRCELSRLEAEKIFEKFSANLGKSKEGYTILIEKLNSNQTMYYKIIMTFIYIVFKLFGKISEYEDYTIYMKYSLLKENIDDFKKEALGRIINIHFSELETLYKHYFYDLNNFKRLSKNIDCFVNNQLTEYFKDVLGDEVHFKQKSLGHRVQNIIESDMSMVYAYNIINQEKYVVENSISNFHKDLVDINLPYIRELKRLQREYDKVVIFSTRSKIDKDIEYYYLESVDEEKLYEKWRKNYIKYVEDSDLEVYKDYIEEMDYEDMLDSI